MNALADPWQITVLFVDDDDFILESLRDVLHHEPYTVLTATSGIAALDVLASNHVDIVISDERMPGMQGSELLAEIYRMYPHTVRIVLTGQASVKAMINAINNGQIFKFLTKPYAPRDLIACIKEAGDVVAQNNPACLRLGVQPV